MFLNLPIVAAFLWLGACTPQTAPSPAPSTTPSQDAPATAPAQPPPPPPPPPPPAQDPPPGAPAEPAIAIDPEIDQLLTKLEAGAAGLTSFAAKIVYEKEDAILERTETRMGEIIYRLEGDGKAFAALFDTLVIPPRMEKRLYHYVFDGRWLAEIDHERKTFIKREIVPPGRVLDPLKLGEGPFPLPVGQAKADVLARFEVAKIDVPAEGLLKSLANVDGLALTPREGTPEARDYRRVEIFYDRATLLPVGINAIESNDDRKTVRLSEMRRNPEIDEAMRRKLDIAEPDPRLWNVKVEPWQHR